MRRWARFVYAALLVALIRYLKWEYRVIESNRALNLRQRESLLQHLADVTEPQQRFKF